MTDIDVVLRSIDGVDDKVVSNEEMEPNNDSMPPPVFSPTAKPRKNMMDLGTRRSTSKRKCIIEEDHGGKPIVNSSDEESTPTRGRKRGRKPNINKLKQSDDCGNDANIENDSTNVKVKNKSRKNSTDSNTSVNNLNESKDCGNDEIIENKTPKSTKGKNKKKKNNADSKSTVKVDGEGKSNKDESKEYDIKNSAFLADNRRRKKLATDEKTPYLNSEVTKGKRGRKRRAESPTAEDLIYDSSYIETPVSGRRSIKKPRRYFDEDWDGNTSIDNADSDSGMITTGTDKSKKPKMKHTGRRPKKDLVEYIIINRFRSYNGIHWGNILFEDSQPVINIVDMKKHHDLKQAVNAYPETFKIPDGLLESLKKDNEAHLAKLREYERLKQEQREKEEEELKLKEEEELKLREEEELKLKEEQEEEAEGELSEITGASADKKEKTNKTPKLAAKKGRGRPRKTAAEAEIFKKFNKNVDESDSEIEPPKKKKVPTATLR